MVTHQILDLALKVRILPGRLNPQLKPRVADVARKSMGEGVFKKFRSLTLWQFARAGKGNTNRNGNRRARGVKYRPDLKVLTDFHQSKV